MRLFCSENGRSFRRLESSVDLSKFFLEISEILQDFFVIFLSTMEVDTQKAFQYSLIVVSSIIFNCATKEFPKNHTKSSKEHPVQPGIKKIQLYSTLDRKKIPSI